MGDFIASQTVKKVIEINDKMLGTMAGGAAVCVTDLCYASNTDHSIGLSILARISRYAVSST